MHKRRCPTGNFPWVVAGIGAFRAARAAYKGYKAYKKVKKVYRAAKTVRKTYRAAKTYKRAKTTYRSARRSYRSYKKVRRSYSKPKVTKRWKKTVRKSSKPSRAKAAKKVTKKKVCMRPKKAIKKQANVRKKNKQGGLNFTRTTEKHMDNPDRHVPMQVLRMAINKGKSRPDPRGTKARMFYSTMYKNGKKYNLEVLYDKSKNMIMHFKYTRGKTGPLPKIE